MQAWAIIKFIFIFSENLKNYWPNYVKISITSNQSLDTHQNINHFLKIDNCRAISDAETFNVPEIQWVDNHLNSLMVQPA